MKLGNILLVTIILIASAVMGQDCPDPIPAGFGLWETARDGDVFPSEFEFGNSPSAHAPSLPADFFGPGSDPFEWTISLIGEPLQTTPAGDLGLTDAIIERASPSSIPDISAPPQTIPIELVALSLVSIAPVVVTYNGGQNPELWDVRVCLSETAISPGFMDISTNCCEGGPYHAELDIMPRFTFSKQGSTQEQAFDFGWGNPPVTWAWDGFWAILPDPPIVHLGVLIDHDCSSSTSDIAISPSTSPSFVITGGPSPWFGDPCAECPDPIAAGHDLWETARDGDIFPPDLEFGGLDIPPIPADFFGPGSDPFWGTIGFIGEPLAGAFGLADAIIERPAPIAIPDPSLPPVTVPIELVALSLVNTSPFVVTYNGGQNPEIWDVKVCLSAQDPSPGFIYLGSDCCEGGLYDAELLIMPRFTFTRVSPPQENVLDFGWEGLPGVPWIWDGIWALEDPIPNIPGPEPIDHDCWSGTSDIIVGPSPRLLITGSTGIGPFSAECQECCSGASVGNMDSDPTPPIDMGDLTLLIDMLFITFTPAPCLSEADIDQSGQPDPLVLDVDMGDLSVLIDHLFLTFTPLLACP